MSQPSYRQNAFIRVPWRALKPALGAPLLVLLAACSGSPPDNLGVRDGRLAPCPASPNCVSSQAANAEHHIEPLPLSGSPSQTRARLLAILASEPRTRVVKLDGNYLRAEFTSRLLRFVDDVEFLVGKQAVEVRSASRLGHSDFGVNRSRIEHLRRRLAQQP